HGTVVRSFSTTAPPPDNTMRNVPDYWFAPPDVLPTAAGLNRFVWNLEWPHPDTLAYSFRGKPLDYVEYTLPDHAIVGKTPMYQPPGPMAALGNYEVVLTIDGHTYRQPLTVELDPRVQVGSGDLEAQVDLARRIDSWMNVSYRAYKDASVLSSVLEADRKS